MSVPWAQKLRDFYLLSYQLVVKTPKCGITNWVRPSAVALVPNEAKKKISFQFLHIFSLYMVIYKMQIPRYWEDPCPLPFYSFSLQIYSTMDNSFSFSSYSPFHTQPTMECRVLLVCHVIQMVLEKKEPKTVGNDCFCASSLSHLWNKLQPHSREHQILLTILYLNPSLAYSHLHVIFLMFPSNLMHKKAEKLLFCGAFEILLPDVYHQD